MSKLKVTSFRVSDKLADKYSKKFSKLIREFVIDVADEIERARIHPAISPFIHREVVMKFLLDMSIRIWELLIKIQSQAMLEAKKRGLAK